MRLLHPEYWNQAYRRTLKFLEKIVPPNAASSPFSGSFFDQTDRNFTIVIILELVLVHLAE